MKKPRKYGKLKRVAFVILFLCAAFFIYVAIVNRHSKNMTYRQKILKAVYPVIMWMSRKTGKNADQLEATKKPVTSFYSLGSVLTNGENFDFNNLRGKKVLIVNTASNCGYTDQYEELQKLADRYAGKLEIIAFPANDFKEQEKGSDEEIAQFCKLNYGVKFPLMKKTTVIKNGNQHPVYQWLTSTSMNGWNEKVPSWNFSKYLINEEGWLTHYFGPGVSPLSEEILKELNH